MPVPAVGTNESRRLCLSHCEGDNGDCVHMLEDEKCNVYSGTNTMLLRPMLERRACRWLTVVRDPFALLVSSLHYCRLHSYSQLCGREGKAHAQAASVRDWAAFRPSPLLYTLLLDPKYQRMMVPPLADGMLNTFMRAVEGTRPIWQLQASVYKQVPRKRVEMVVDRYNKKEDTPDFHLTRLASRQQVVTH